MHEPVARYRYQLTRADALACEGLSRELRGWRKLLFLLWLGCAGLELALLPPDWIGDDYGWRFWLALLALIGMNWLIARGVMLVARHLRALRRIPAPVDVELDDWGDHLTMRAGNRNTVLAYEMIAATTLTDTHLFIHAPPEVVIVPLSAFADPTDAAALAAVIEAAGRDD